MILSGPENEKRYKKCEYIELHIHPKISLSLFCRRMTSLTQIAIGLITLHISIM